MDGRVRVVVVGGGASGLVAAICAARAGADVTVLEGASRVGQKILKTGNGRCNLTNARVGPADYRNGAAIMPLLEEFSPTRVLGFFGELGLLVSEEEEGRIYPLSNAANTVLDVLRAGCKWHAVDVRCGQKVVEIARMQPDGYRIICANETTSVPTALLSRRVAERICSLPWDIRSSCSRPCSVPSRLIPGPSRGSRAFGPGRA